MQAAQKIIQEFRFDVVVFAAMQAAQKGTTVPVVPVRVFAAMQAAQKINITYRPDSWSCPASQARAFLTVVQLGMPQSFMLFRRPASESNAHQRKIREYKQRFYPT